jgi:hypothetical protein
MKTFRYILLFGFFCCFKSINAQADLIKANVCSDFIDQAVYVHDTTFNKDSDLIIVSGIKNYDLASNLDIESLSDYLFGNTESNELFQLIKQKYGKSPISYFYDIPWGEFGSLLTQDSTFGFMILELNTLLQGKYKIQKVNISHTNYELKFTNGKIPHGSDSWERFYKRNKNCFGILKLSDILISDDGKYAVFYTESYHYSLFASGDLVFMELTDSSWKVLHYINIWVS